MSWIVNPFPSASYGQFYYFLVEDAVNVTAEAYFGRGTKLTVIEPNSTITPPEVKVLKPSEKECKIGKDKRKKKTLVCVAYNFYPDHVSVFWQVDGQNVTDGVATDSAARRQEKHYYITSRLRVPFKEWFDPEKNFTCTVSFFNGTDTVSTTKWISGSEEQQTATEEYLRVTHSARLSYGVLIVKSSIYGVFVVFLLWRLQGSCGKQND